MTGPMKSQQHRTVSPFTSGQSNQCIWHTSKYPTVFSKLRGRQGPDHAVWTRRLIDPLLTVRTRRSVRRITVVTEQRGTWPTRVFEVCLFIVQCESRCLLWERSVCSLVRISGTDPGLFNRCFKGSEWSRVDLIKLPYLA